MFAKRRSPHPTAHSRAGTVAQGSRNEVVVPPRRQPHGTVVRLPADQGRRHLGSDTP
ncbi:hypothetical protein ACFW9O_03270 [Streptomyces sp. NPDC059499]|uniref:hypothetical protein n=1 Tax=Streptomyces sp. NPDC059499 TaxID=3346852 RepID=UPI0036AB8E27